MQGAFDQARVGLGVRTKRDHAPDGRGFGAAFEMAELRTVAIEHRHAVFLQSEKNLSLGVGDLGERAEKFQMHRRDRGDDRDMRTRQPR